MRKSIISTEGKPWVQYLRLSKAEAAEDRDKTKADKALYLTWLAHAYLDADQPDKAAAVTGHGLDLAAGVGSVRPGGRLGGVLQRLTRYGGPEVSAVLEQARG